MDNLEERDFKNLHLDVKYILMSLWSGNPQYQNFLYLEEDLARSIKYYSRTSEAKRNARYDEFKTFFDTCVGNLNQPRPVEQSDTPKENLNQKSENEPEQPEKKKKTKIKEGQMKIDLRGGARVGAGRKNEHGIKHPVSITLPAESWKYIDSLVEQGIISSRAGYFRQLHFDEMRKE